MRETYEVRFEEPGEYLIWPDTQEDMDCAGTPVMVGQIASGEWLAWIPYYEDDHRDSHENPKQAIAENKHVAAGAIQDYYWGDPPAETEDEEEVE